MDFVSIPAKIQLVCKKPFTIYKKAHIQKFLTMGVQAGICNDLHTTLLFLPVQKPRENNEPLAGHKTWWCVTEMLVHSFHTPVCWNCPMLRGERMAPAMKSLTMHCMSHYRCFKKPAVHFGTNKFAPWVNHIELENSQLLLHCAVLPLHLEG